jgi:two-component system, NarL family, response regulator DegU
MDTIRIALVDDQLLFRQSLATVVESQPGFSLVLDADNGIACLEQLKEMITLPHIALIDLEMPGMDGIELNEELQKKYPSIKVVILSVHNKEKLMARMIQAGACGYLVKNCDKKELITAIQTVYTSGFYISHAVLQAIQSDAAKGRQPIRNISAIPVDISRREIEILQLICRELSNAEIAAKLFISVRTVDGHRNKLLQKAGCHNTAGLVLFAVKNNIFEVIF